MLGEKKERWFELCELAAKEQDSEKLLTLVGEINSLLEEKEKRLFAEKENSGRQRGEAQPKTS